MRVFACARAIAVACAAILGPAAAAALPDDAAVRALLTERIDQKRGVAFAVVLLDSRGVRIVTIGPMRREGPPVSADTEFEIGSLNKTFTSLLLADAVVRGAAALDDPVTKYLEAPAPGVTRDGKAVTLGQLATHTSGLPRLPKNLSPADPTDPYADYDGAILERLVGSYELARGFVVTVRREGERVFTRATGQAEAEIFPESDCEYFYKVVDAQLLFLRDGGQRVSGFVLHQAGRNLVARRID